MKKLIAVLASALLLASCGSKKVENETNTPTETPAVEENNPNLEGGENIEEAVAPTVDTATEEVVTEIDKIAESEETEVK